MEFHPITLDDRDLMQKKFLEDDRKACEYTFANNFIWRNIYQVETAMESGVALIRFKEKTACYYSFPSGNGDKERVIALLMEQAREQREKLVLTPLVSEDKENLEQWFPGCFEITEERDSFDYIYRTERLSKLGGKKLHAKRNHINRFKEAGDWSYEAMTTENIPECKRMNHIWNSVRDDKWNEDMAAEFDAVGQAMRYFTELSLEGGVLRREGKIVGFSIGEPLNSDTYNVHIEKAYPDIQGAYPMINQQFVLARCQNFTYVNREEDTGEEGLRKAKLSYGPDILLEKYTAVCRA